MIKIKANPLVIAAALGLLGPAALAEDEDDAGLGGLWQRSTPSTTSAVTVHPAQLGPQIQLLPLDNRYVLDNGADDQATTKDDLQETWTTEGAVTQTVQAEGISISREFIHQGDALTIRTVVDQDNERLEYTDVYTRVS